jgi:hypothetical protein
MPALRASETGMRLGDGARVEGAFPERNGVSTRSSSSPYPRWVCRMGLGRPVVPEVQRMKAVPGA